MAIGGNMISRRKILISGAALAGSSAFGWAAAAVPSTSLPFLVVGDWGIPNQAESAKRVASTMGLVADEIAARFVISTGDNFYNEGVESIDDPLWQVLFEQVYNALSLNCPWYVVLGNHDYGGNPDAELAYSHKSLRWRMPSRYYSTHEVFGDGTTADFFFLDTQPLAQENWWNDLVGHAAQAQLAWLEDELRKSRARWKFVVGHHPVYSGGAHGNTPALISGVRPLLYRYGVQAYFNGHDHDLQHIEVGGVHYFTSGAGAETRETKPIEGTLFAASKLGFIAAEVEQEGMRVRFIGEDGKALHQAIIPSM